MRFLRKLKVELPYDPEVTLLGIYSKNKRKLLTQGDTCIPMVIAALSTIAKLWKEPQSLSTNECIKK